MKPSVRIWKIDGKRRALAFARAFGADSAAMALDDITDYREADAEASMHSCAEVTGLSKSFKDVRQEFRTDSNSGITDTNVRPSRRVLEPDLDNAALPCEFDRIRE